MYRRPTKTCGHTVCNYIRAYPTPFAFKTLYQNIRCNNFYSLLNSRPSLAILLVKMDRYYKLVSNEGQT